MIVAAARWAAMAPGIFRRGEAEECPLTGVLVLRIDDPVRLVISDRVAADRRRHRGDELDGIPRKDRHHRATVEVGRREEEAVGLRAVEDRVPRTGLVEALDSLARGQVPLDRVVRRAAAAAEERVVRRRVYRKPVRVALRNDIELLYESVLRGIELEDHVLRRARHVDHAIVRVVSRLLEA